MNQEEDLENRTELLSRSEITHVCTKYEYCGMLEKTALIQHSLIINVDVSLLVHHSQRKPKDNKLRPYINYIA